MSKPTNSSQQNCDNQLARTLEQEIVDLSEEIRTKEAILLRKGNAELAAQVRIDIEQMREDILIKGRKVIFLKSLTTPTP